jgi:hypothetical protein
MDVPHYVYLKLKIPGNNGTNIKVHGSFSRSDNCDHEFQRIAAKFGLKQEPNEFPSKSSALDNKEDEHVKKLKKKPDDLALKALAADGKAIVEESKTVVLTARTPDETNDASKATVTSDKIEDKKNPPLV